MPEYAKDVALALLGGSIGLAGLLLVVAGFVLSQAGTFPAETSDALLKRYDVAAKLGLVPFFLALVDGGLCLWWLLQSSRVLYDTAVGGFFVVLLLTAVYGFVLIWKYL